MLVCFEELQVLDGAVAAEAGDHRAPLDVPLDLGVRAALEGWLAAMEPCLNHRGGSAAGAPCRPAVSYYCYLE